jgi:hypothetical protein
VNVVSKDKPQQLCLFASITLPLTICDNPLGHIETLL